MTNDRRQDQPTLLRRLVAEQVAGAPPALPWEDVTHRTSVDDDHRPRPRPLVAAAGVAASVAALVVGLVVVGELRDTMAPATSPSLAPPTRPSGPTPLAAVDTIGDDEWVVPTEVPGAIEFQYALDTRADVPGTTLRSVRAGNDERPEAVVIHLDLQPSRGSGSREVRIGDVTWQVVTGSPSWEATRETDPRVVVYGQGAFDDSARAVLAGLIVVDTADLPFPPLSPDGPMTEVATFDLDGETYRYQIQEANGYYCTRVTSDAGGGGGGCGGPLDGDPATDVFLSFPGGGGYDIAMGADTLTANDYGIVSDRVAEVEVEFVDGTVVRVPASNPTSEFSGLRFWVAAAEVAAPDGVDPDRIVPVLELRAYDASGSLLDSST